MNRGLFIPAILMLVGAISTKTLSGQTDSLSDNARYTITRKFLSIEDGLASHEVFCGLQDQAGFMWFGTRNGLNRYDGKNCLLFTRQRSNLQENKVVQLAKDDGNHLFIEYGSTGFQLTTIGKVDVMDAVTHEVKTLSAAFPHMPFKEQDVYWIANDGTDDINLLTAFPFRLWKYSSKLGFRLRYEIHDWQQNESAADYRSTGPFCLFARGMVLWKIFNQSTQYLVSKDTVISFLQKKALRSLPLGFTDQNDLLITYTENPDYNRFKMAMVTPAGETVSALPVSTYHLGPVAERYWSQATAGANGGACAMYISTDALYLWNKNAFLKIAVKGDIKSFENLFLYQLFSDRFGNLWVCTSLGVLQLRVEKNRFSQYFTSKEQSVQPNSQARGIYADEKGKVLANIWTHTFQQEAGIIRYVSDYEIKYALIHHHSDLYCAGFNLFHYDDQKNTLSAIAGGQGSEIWSMYSVNDSLLLLGRTNGFSMFHSNTGKFDSLRYAMPNTPQAKFVYRFFKDEAGALWAVAENGLYAITNANGQCSAHKEGSPLIQALSLLDAYVDDHGIYWLATNGEGLYRWDRKKNSIAQFSVANGLPSDVLYRIEPDAFHNLWISSDHGLIRFNSETDAVTTYATVDGISHNEFNRTSSFKASDGRLFFGGLDGVNAFNPKDFISDTHAIEIPLRIISFSQFDGSKKQLLTKTTDLLRTSVIELPPGDQFFTLEFELLDYSKDELHRYAYQIEGVDKDWNYISENSVRISGLPYGNFVLHIKAQNRAGAWSRSQLTIPVHVLKPFYLQWWFIALLIFLLAIMVYGIIKARTNQLAADKSKLENLVDERTRQLKKALSAQAELLAEKDVLMKEIHHRVKNNLQVISGLLELQSRSISDPTAKGALREGRNRVQSIALIHQNLYQIENIASIDLRRFVNDLCHQVETIFHKYNKVVMQIDVEPLHLDIDTAVPLGLILNELLSNSFKYAFADGVTGKINISIHTVGEGKYQLLYADNGPGLPADYNPDMAATLGMQLIRDLSRQIGGSVAFLQKGGIACTINFTNRAARKNED